MRAFHVTATDRVSGLYANLGRAAAQDDDDDFAIISVGLSDDSPALHGARPERKILAVATA